MLRQFLRRLVHHPPSTSLPTASRASFLRLAAAV
jgi:hypothetical protein